MKSSSHQNRVCCLFNYAPHYRKRIFQLLEKDCSCDLYFGDATATAIKKMDYALLDHPKELKYIRGWLNFYILKGALQLSFLPYKKYIITGEVKFFSSWLMLIVNRISGRKTYLWTHGLDGGEKGLNRWLTLSYFHLANGLLLFSQHGKNILLKQGYPEKKLHVIYNSMDYDQQLLVRNNLLKQEKNSPRQHPVIVFSGRLGWSKRVDLLLEAIAMLKNQHSMILETIIIGDGPELPQLKALAQKLEIEQQVVFTGACYEEEIIAGYIFRADICVSPGEVGLTAIHSMMYGTPVISHDDLPDQGPEHEAIIEGKTGAFHQKGNAASVAAAIEKWLDRYPQKTPTVANACFEIVDQFYNPHQQVNVLKKILFGASQQLD